MLLLSAFPAAGGDSRKSPPPPPPPPMPMSLPSVGMMAGPPPPRAAKAPCPIYPLRCAMFFYYVIIY